MESPNPIRCFLTAVLFALLSQHHVTGQDRNTGLTIELLNDSIYVDDGKIDIDYSITNDSDTTLVYYSLGGEIGRSLTGKIERLCELDKVGADFLFVIYDKDNIWRRGTFRYVSDYSRPMTVERFDSAMNAAIRNKLKSTVVLNKDESRILNQRISLLKYSLTKGQYYLQLVYYSGEAVFEVFGREQIEGDLEKHSAMLFQGCVTSKRVKLIVR